MLSGVETGVSRFSATPAKNLRKTHMRKAPMKNVVVVVLSLFAASCSVLPSTDTIMNTRLTTGGLLGAAVGGALGGYAGSYVGGGIAQTMAIAGGALIGGVSGYSIGERLYPSDVAAYDATARTAIAQARDGEIRGWSNPDTGNGGIVRPVRTFIAQNGATCRDYRSTFAFPDGAVSADGTACKQANGD